MEGFQDLILSKIRPLDRELGRGAYGRIYEVDYCGKICAAKEIHPILITGVTKEEAQRTINSFLNECQRCTRLGHPNIVQFFGIYYPESNPEGEDATKIRVPVMVMEKMASSLTSFVEAQQIIAVDLKFSIIKDVACGLCCLHSQDPPILHRDLTSNNILLSDYNVAKIADFGVSKVKQAGVKNTKAPGTPDFMPPEAFDDDNDETSTDYDCSLDVFSFAGIVLHTFTQKWPKPSTATTLDRKTRKLTALTEVERRVKYLDLMTGKSEVLRPLVEKCLDNDPHLRPSMEIIHEILHKTTLPQDILEQSENINSQLVS